MKTILLTAFAVAPFAHGVPVIDNFDDASNITNFGPTVVSVSSNTLSVTLSSTGLDSGIDWRNDGGTFFSLDPADSQFQLNITPDAAIGDGQWSTFVLFHDTNGTYLGEEQISSFTPSTSVFSDNIAQVAVDNNYTTATDYFVRVRFQGDTNSGFEFSQFAAVPEPSQYALIGGAALGAIAIIRRRRSK